MAPHLKAFLSRLGFALGIVLFVSGCVHPKQDEFYRFWTPTLLEVVRRSKEGVVYQLQANGESTPLKILSSEGVSLVSSLLTQPTTYNFDEVDTQSFTPRLFLDLIDGGERIRIFFMPEEYFLGYETAQSMKVASHKQAGEALSRLLE